MLVLNDRSGDDVNHVPQILREGNNALHMYGKAEVKEGRKMGHVNRIQVKAS